MFSKVLGSFVMVSSLVFAPGCNTSPTASGVADDQGTTNDLPTPVWTCNDGFADGGKRVTVSRDQFQQYSVEVIQEDQFSGATVLATFPSVDRKVGHDGFVPYEVYGATDLNSLKMFTMFVNIIDSASEQSGRLRLVVDDELLLVDLTCHAGA